MQIIRDPNGPVVLIGGTGVVGRELVMLLAARGTPLVLAGRDAGRAEPVLALARGLGAAAQFVRLDLAKETPLRLEASAAITLVNDGSDRVLLASIAGGVPYVDIARWTSRVAFAVTRTAVNAPRAPVVFSSSWMGGLAPRVAAALGAGLGTPLDAVDIAVRYAAADASGADSVEYMDRLTIPFDVLVHGRQVQVMPLTDGRRVDVGGNETLVLRIDTPEQWTLPATLGVRSAALRIGFDDGLTSFALRAAHRLGVFRLLQGERFTAARRGLLRSAGAEKRPGSETAFRVDVRGRDGSTDHVSIVDPKGQAHLTAAGALLSIDLALRADAPRGVLFPEQDPVNASLFGRLAELGVEVRRGERLRLAA